MKTLRQAVINQMGGKDAFNTSYADIANHGADGGFNGFTYYTDTIAFTKRNKVKILELVDQWADDFGQDRVQFLKGFGCLKHLSLDEIARGLYQFNQDQPAVYNALAWFTLEEVARIELDHEHERQPVLSAIGYLGAQV